VTTHHRITRPVAATLVALSIGCAQASARSGHGLPTAGPAARTVPAAPSSSDGRQPTIVRVTPDHGGFDWDDAGIGAAAGFALSMIGLGAAMRFHSSARGATASRASPTDEPMRTRKDSTMRTRALTIALTVLCMSAPPALAARGEISPVPLRRTQIAPLPTARGGLVSVVADGQIFSIGGATSGFDQTLNTVEAYDPHIRAWRTVTSAGLTPRADLGAASADGRIYAIGGYDSNGNASAAIESYDPRDPAAGWRSEAADRVIDAGERVVANEILMHPGRQQPRLLREPLIDQRLERVQLRRHPLAPIDRLGALLEITLHRQPVTTNQPADLGIRIALARQRPDVHQLLLGDHPSLHARQHKPLERQDPAGQNQPGVIRQRTRTRGIVAPPGLLTRRARIHHHQPQPTYIFRCAPSGIIRCLRAGGAAVEDRLGRGARRRPPGA